MKAKILIAEFPYGDVSHSEVSRYVSDCIVDLHKDKRFGSEGVFRYRVADTPITMGRNRALITAEKHDIDFVLMIDSDMNPDMYQGAEGFRPFLPTSLEFMLERPDVGAVVAPYCGKPPHENVFVFRWSNFASDEPNRQNFLLDQYTRFEAATKSGFEQVGAGPTGLCLLNMAAVRQMRHPRFYYEWTDKTHSEKASTEDVTFFRDMNWAGYSVWCLWDAWAGHFKTKCVGKPDYYRPGEVETRIAEGILQEAVKKFNVPQDALKQQLQTMYKRPDET